MFFVDPLKMEADKEGLCCPRFSAWCWKYAVGGNMLVEQVYGGWGSFGWTLQSGDSGGQGKCGLWAGVGKEVRNDTPDSGLLGKFE